jgi:hypothetical protein
MKEFKFLPHPDDICKWCNQILPDLSESSDDEEVIRRFKAYAGVSGEPVDMMYMDDFYGEFKTVCPGSDRHLFTSEFASHILLQDRDWTSNYDPTWLSPLIIAGFFSQINGYRSGSSIQEYDLDNPTFITRQLISWCCSRMYGEPFSIASPQWYLASWYSQINDKLSASILSLQPTVYIKSMDCISNPFNSVPFIGLDNQSQWTNYVHRGILSEKGMDDNSFIKRHNLVIRYLASFRKYNLGTSKDFDRTKDINNLKAYCLAYVQTLIWCRLNYIHRYNRISSSRDYARIQGNGMKWRLIYDEKYDSDLRKYIPRWGWDIQATPYAKQMCDACPPLIANGSPVSATRIIARTPSNKALPEQILPADIYVSLGGLYPGLYISDASLWDEIVEWATQMVNDIPPSAALDSRGAGLWQLPLDLPSTPFVGLNDGTSGTDDDKINSCILSGENISVDPFLDLGDTFGRTGDVMAGVSADGASNQVYTMRKVKVNHAYIRMSTTSRLLEPMLGELTMRWLKDVPKTQLPIGSNIFPVHVYSEVVY